MLTKLIDLFSKATIILNKNQSNFNNIEFPKFSVPFPFFFEEERKKKQFSILGKTGEQIVSFASSSLFPNHNYSRKTRLALRVFSPPELRQLRVLANLGWGSFITKSRFVAAKCMVNWVQSRGQWSTGAYVIVDEVIDACAFKSFSNHGPRSASTI